MVPVIYNEGGADINIRCTGNNYIRAGNDLPNKDEAEYLINADTAQLIFDLTYPLYKMYKNAKNWTYKASASGLLKGKEGFLESYMNSMYQNKELIERWGKTFLGLLGGTNGVNGMNGVPAIESFGSIGIYGKGNITIKGGDGGPGGDAKAGFTDTYGGVGGNGGPAISCYI